MGTAFKWPVLCEVPGCGIKETGAVGQQRTPLGMAYSSQPGSSYLGTPLEGAGTVQPASGQCILQIAGVMAATWAWPAGEHPEVSCHGAGGSRKG